jgi:hypothetical protein
VRTHPGWELYLWLKRRFGFKEGERLPKWMLWVRTALTFTRPPLNPPRNGIWLDPAFDRLYVFGTEYDLEFFMTLARAPVGTTLTILERLPTSRGTAVVIDALRPGEQNGRREHSLAFLAGFWMAYENEAGGAVHPEISAEVDRQAARAFEKWVNLP